MALGPVIENSLDVVFRIICFSCQLLRRLPSSLLITGYSPPSNLLHQPAKRQSVQLMIRRLDRQELALPYREEAISFRYRMGRQVHWYRGSLGRGFWGRTPSSILVVSYTLVSLHRVNPQALEPSLLF